jgi:sterol desaturase/sphingolipid hydroxylase (fatty acid hydroxylase superfamily)
MFIANVLLIAFDFAQWLIHNMLHRVPWLWNMDKIHHSIEEMDWIGNWRFHLGEVVVYKSLLYVPAAFFGFSGVAMFWYGVASTLIGHFSHSNVHLNLGPFKYLLNSPEMHICTTHTLSPARSTETSASLSASGIGSSGRPLCLRERVPTG